MLNRKAFVATASCVLCSLPALTDPASAQTPAATAGITRTILSRIDGPVAGYETIVVEGYVDAGAVIAPHTHPGVESAYLLEGGFELPVNGQPSRMLKPGDAYQIPVGVVHGGGKPGPTKSRILSTYVVEKGKPLASPA